MVRNDTKPKSVRKALREVSNNNNIIHTNINYGGGGGGFSKSMNLTKKSISKKELENQHVVAAVQRQEGGRGEGEEEEEYLDRLLLVQSDLSSLTRRIDELVAQAFKMKVTSKRGKREIESFSHVLSDMLSSLTPWVPRFQKALSNPSAESENQLGWSLAEKTVSAVNEDENFKVESPEQTGMNSLISPSPFVSWRAECDIDRGRQLFLLTPLPMSKTLSSKRQDLSKSVSERTSNPAAELPSFRAISGDVNDDLLEGIATKPTPNKPSDLVVTKAKTTRDSESILSPNLSRSDHSALFMTPCLKMSPPKSCVLLEPISETSHKGKAIARKSTPFPTGMHSQISESSSESEDSDDLAMKYPELLGIQRACISRMGKKDLGTSPSWIFSPPKTCVLLEPPDEKPVDSSAPDNHLTAKASVLNKKTELILSKEWNGQGGCHEVEKFFNEGGNLTLIESTPILKEPESTMKMGKRPGENTLKKELWTKFEAASTYGIRLNVSTLRKTAQKVFLDMLDEVSFDGETTVADGLR